MLEPSSTFVFDKRHSYAEKVFLSSNNILPKTTTGENIKARYNVSVARSVLMNFRSRFSVVIAKIGPDMLQRIYCTKTTNIQLKLNKFIIIAWCCDSHCYMLSQMGQMSHECVHILFLNLAVRNFFPFVLFLNSSKVSKIMTW